MKDITKKVLIGKPVLVEWIDSMQSSGWHDHKIGNMNCITIGHYHSEYSDRIVIAMNRSLEGEVAYGSFMEIPKCSIKKVTKLK